MPESQTGVRVNRPHPCLAGPPVAPLLSERRRTPSQEKGESVSILYRELVVSFSPHRRKSVPSLSLSLSLSCIYREEADSFSMQMRACLPCIQRVCRLLLDAGQSGSRSVCRGESVLILFREEADSFLMNRRECCPSYTVSCHTLAF